MYVHFNPKSFYSKSSGVHLRSFDSFIQYFHFLRIHTNIISCLFVWLCEIGSYIEKLKWKAECQCTSVTENMFISFFALTMNTITYSLPVNVNKWFHSLLNCLVLMFLLLDFRLIFLLLLFLNIRFLFYFRLPLCRSDSYFHCSFHYQRCHLSNERAIHVMSLSIKSNQRQRWWRT